MKCVERLLLAFLILMPCGCEYVDHSGEEKALERSRIPADSVAMLLSVLPLEAEHYREVYDAVSSSSGNGYDEEYMMRDLFTSPGAGVGDDADTRGAKTKSYSRPIKDLIKEYCIGVRGVRSSYGDLPSFARDLPDLLEKSDMQIYWPYSENWDGVTRPIVTFDPGTEADSSEGYILEEDSEGRQSIRKVRVDEEDARKHPIWVINRNDDSQFVSLELRRRQNPDWKPGGGIVTVRSSEQVNTLVLKNFKMRRNYDSWLAGASEFFVKCGKVEDFKATTEAELKLYNPSITDFMIVVKRDQVGKTIPFNAVLVSQWTDQIENVAFMIVEDDGGTRTEWKASAVVKYNSKSYGFEISLPFNVRDDIVWRGQLSGKYLWAYDNKPSRFGDVELTFQFQ